MLHSEEEEYVAGTLGHLPHRREEESNVDEEQEELLDNFCNNFGVGDYEDEEDVGSQLTDNDFQDQLQDNTPHGIHSSAHSAHYSNNGILGEVNQGGGIVSTSPSMRSSSRSVRTAPTPVLPRNIARSSVAGSSVASAAGSLPARPSPGHVQDGTPITRESTSTLPLAMRRERRKPKSNQAAGYKY